MPAIESTHGYPTFTRIDEPAWWHGVAVDDPFRLLEGGPGEDSVERWCAAQRVLARGWLDASPHRERFEYLLDAVCNPPMRSVPTVRQDRFFYSECTYDGRPALVFLEHGGVRTCVINPADWASADTARITAWSVSPDGTLLAFQVCANGEEVGTLHILDVDSAVVIASIDELRAPSVAWAGTTGLYYPRSQGDKGLHYLDLTTGKHTWVWQPERSDAPVFSVPLVSPDGRWLAVSVRFGADRRNSLLFGPAAPDAGSDLARLVGAGEAISTVRFGPSSDAFVLTYAGAPGGRILQIDPQDPRSTSWREVYSEGSGWITAIAATRHAVAVCRRVADRSDVFLVDTGSGGVTPVALGDFTTVSGLTTAGDRIWIACSRAADPVAVMEVTLPAAGPTTLRPWFVSAGWDDDQQLVVETGTYQSTDGSEVTLNILSDGVVTGTARPTILSVYGGFGLSSERGFRTETAAWVRSGGVHVIAEIRGGGERGVEWHHAGRGVNKPRSVEDVVAAAEYLINSGRTTRDMLAVIGTSNGGLMASAAAIKRPELFRACVATHPVTDMIRYPELGDGKAWLNEYGDPAASEEFAALRSYSPYHNVAPGTAYPAFLIMAGGSDPRVPPAHARKLAAALQHASTADPECSPVLLREEQRAGHGHIPLSESKRWSVDRLTFIYECLVPEAMRHRPLTG